jgi:anti-anti-sigma factor
MEIKESRRGSLVFLDLSGNVDTRSTHELELAVTNLLDKGDRLFAIGFQDVEELTGSGLRVLVMLAKNLAGLDGGLVLYSINPSLKTIFDVSGLTSLFAIVPDKKEAMRHLSSPKRMSKVSLLATKILDGGKEEDPRDKKEAMRHLSSPRRMSKVSLLATKILDGGKEEDPRAKKEEPNGARRGSRLSKQVVRLLSTEAEDEETDPANQ